MSKSETPDFVPIREFMDRGVRWLLESPENVRGLLTIIAQDLAQRLDFSRAERVPATFLPADLYKQESDILLRVPYRDPALGEVWIILLIEHQSEPDRRMGLRFLCYMVHVWSVERRRLEENKVAVSEWVLPLIVPVLLYTGSALWKEEVSVRALMSLPPELEPFVPTHAVLWLGVKRDPPERLTATGHPVGWLLRALREEEAPKEVLEQILREAMHFLEGLAEEHRAQWLQAAHFLLLLIYHRRPVEEHEELAKVVLEAVEDQRLREEVSAMGKTMAEVLMEQGWEKGRKEGRIVAKQEAVLRLLRVRWGQIPPERVSQIEAIWDPERLDELFDQVLTGQDFQELSRG
jgi:hypothetical protein